MHISMKVPMARMFESIVLLKTGMREATRDPRAMVSTGTPMG